MSEISEEFPVGLDEGVLVVLVHIMPVCTMPNLTTSFSPILKKPKTINFKVTIHQAV